MFCLAFSVHQKIQSTPQGAVFFITQVLQVEIFLSPGYKLEDEEDGTVYNDGGGGDLDQFVPRREWPDKTLPEVPEFPLPVPSQASATASADRAQLIADLQAVHDASAKSLEPMGVNACKVYICRTELTQYWPRLAQGIQQFLTIHEHWSSLDMPRYCPYKADNLV